MRRCKVSYFIPGTITLEVQPGEEDTAEDLITDLQEGRAPTWLKTQVVAGLHIKEIEIEKVSMSGGEPDAEEELNFDEPEVRKITMEEGVLRGDDIDDLDWDS